MDDNKLIKHSFLFKFLGLNIFGLAMIFLLAATGWLATIYIADIFHVSKIIAALFIMAMSMIAHHVYKVDKAVSSGYMPKSLNALRIRLGSSLKLFRQLGSSLVLLGLAGTVVGLIFATDAIDVNKIGDTSAIGPMLGTMIHAISAKFYTTLIGTVLNIWVGLNCMLIGSTHSRWMADIVEIKEADDVGK